MKPLSDFTIEELNNLDAAVGYFNAAVASYLMGLDVKRPAAMSKAKEITIEKMKKFIEDNNLSSRFRIDEEGKFPAIVKVHGTE